MYAGITTGLFEIISIDRTPNLLVYTVLLDSRLSNNLTVGASVSIDGVCQTVASVDANKITFHAIAETLSKTTLQDLFVGRKVSVERSLRVGEENGGHELAGHIFETGKIINKTISKSNLCLTIQCSPQCIAFIFEKGFVALDGSSLTANNVDQNSCTFQVHLIPETLRRTNFKKKSVEEKINIEVDAKTVAIVETIRRSFLHRLDQLEARIKRLETR
jgi:riboflavin synthase